MSASGAVHHGGTAACHTGQLVTWEEMLNSKFQFCNYLDTMTADSPPPGSKGVTQLDR